MVVVKEYEQEDGKHPFSIWFDSLNVQAALKVRTAIARMEAENFSSVESVGQGVKEYKVNFGPGYRIYFGNDGDKLVILLGGGTKKRQSRVWSGQANCDNPVKPLSPIQPSLIHTPWG